MQRYYYSNMHHLAMDFADFAATALKDALAKQPKASLVVPGGNTPRHYLPTLGRHLLPWDRITVTLSDERWVDTRTAISNEHLVRKYLLAQMTDQANFIGLKTHHLHPSAAITEIHERLVKIPRPFSLTILGLGEDGHVASLFPGMHPDQQTTSLCLAVETPIAPSLRISLTLAALADSHHIALIVTGTTKRRLLDRLNETLDPKIPLVWLLQRSSAPITIFETDTF